VAGDSTFRFDDRRPVIPLFPNSTIVRVPGVSGSIILQNPFCVLSKSTRGCAVPLVSFGDELDEKNGRYDTAAP